MSVKAHLIRGIFTFVLKISFRRSRGQAPLIRTMWRVLDTRINWKIVACLWTSRWEEEANCLHRSTPVILCSWSYCLHPYQSQKCKRRYHRTIRRHPYSPNKWAEVSWAVDLEQKITIVFLCLHVKEWGTRGGDSFISQKKCTSSFIQDDFSVVFFTTHSRMTCDPTVTCQTGS